MENILLSLLYEAAGQVQDRSPIATYPYALGYAARQEIGKVLRIRNLSTFRPAPIC
jgi:hypothetical protein